MIYSGTSIRVASLEGDDKGIYELCFDRKDESVNKFDALTLRELEEALTELSKLQGKGLLLTSGKDKFIVGADIMEFGETFSAGDSAISDMLTEVNHTFNKLETLPFATVAAINGYALGGGLEVCLACDFRLMSTNAKIGLPETRLGIIPGWGGTVRLPRIAGLDVAVEWIAGAKEYDAQTALNANVVDGVVSQDLIRSSAIKVLHAAAAGDFDIKALREQKDSPLAINDTESLLAFESSKAFVKGTAGRNYPAPVEAIQAMQNAAKLGRDDALKVENASFVKMAKTDVAEALVGIFIADQMLGKKARHWEKQSDKAIEKAAVLGAGIMGGGIAYQSAYKGVPIIMKDIGQSGIDLGLTEAAALLTKRVERGRMSAADMATTLNRIDPSLSYDGFDSVDIVVEAVVEKESVKQSVLKEVEELVSSDTVLCSNTSTISIDSLANALTRPERFCGMHFFNPVHRMPLVEVIRGEKTSDSAIARTVAYANKLGKKAVVVKDCPGFLVNRVLFPYFAGFSLLLRDGGDIQQIDKVMERWGWPMGPAMLLDVVGIDTAVHAEKVMAEGFPDRMKRDFKAASDALFEANRLGQKNGKGFYTHGKDKKGKPVKTLDDETMKILSPHVAESKTFSDDEIIARLIVPMATELARCLEEGIVASPQEADMALVYGLGFPPFRGGLFRWIDSVGISAFQAMAAPLVKLGPLYELPEGMSKMAATGQSYYQPVA